MIEKITLGQIQVRMIVQVVIQEEFVDFKLLVVCTRNNKIDTSV